MSIRIRLPILLVLLSSIARAQVVINFDDRPGIPPPFGPITPEFLINNQYAALGVVFSSAGGGIVVTAPSNPVSPPNTVAATVPGPVIDYSGPVDATFQIDGVATTVDTVSLTFSNSSSPGRLEAYDENGGLLGSTSGGASAVLTITFPGLIHSVRIQQGPMAFDDFTFDGLRPIWRLESILPTSGSEAGGDLLHVVGSRLDSLSTPVVSVGGVPATIVATTPDQFIVRTPPGTGIADVSVTNGGRSQTLSSVYTFVNPTLAVRAGNVNVGIGGRENVLVINAVSGDALTREVSFRVGQPIQAVMQPPSSRTSARFAMYLWGRSPNAATRTDLPLGLGGMALAPPFLGGSPHFVWNNVGRQRALGVPSFPSTPAPSLLFARSGVPSPLLVTLQGLIEDGGSQSATGFSVTNAIILRIVP